MPDSSAAAARALTFLLGGAVALLAPGVVLDSALGRTLEAVGLWSLALGPFLVLVIVSAGRARTRWFAAATIALLIIGFVIAR